VSGLEVHTAPPLCGAEYARMSVDIHTVDCTRCLSLAFPTPVCPLCGTPPFRVMGDVTQAFCGNSDCNVFTWNPREGVDQIGRAGFIDLTHPEQMRGGGEPE
jgi:hypothetical protein